jgi:hypothetical protein
MELFSEEVRKIKGLLKDWHEHPEIEVEATFGKRGQVDVQTFLRVVQRLKAKGYEAISQIDRLTISLKNNLRFTIGSTGEVADYCRDNRIDNKNFTAIIKDRATTKEKEESSTIDLKEYDVRVKGRREIELQKDDPRVQTALQGWATETKYFRLIRRWTFLVPGMKFDLSMVRNTRPDPKTGIASQRKFQDQPLLNYQPVYEIEVELDRESMPEGSTPDDALKTLVRGAGDILRGIQGNAILTRNTSKEHALQAYFEVTKLKRFRGVQPVTLNVENMIQEKTERPNINDGYNVTDKADGLRVHGLTDKEGELFMIDMSMNVYRTGLKNSTCRNCLLDGEFVTQDKNGKGVQDLLFFDIYYLDGKDVSKKPFKGGRHTDMVDWYKIWSRDGAGPDVIVKGSAVNVGLKRFFFADTTKTIFEQATAVLRQDEIRPYHTDGLILTPNDVHIPEKAGARWEHQFKWKPAEENTIDFLVTTLKEEDIPTQDKISIGLYPDTEKSIRYKTLQLFVGSTDEPALEDPRATILNMLPLPDAVIGKKSYAKYKPVPFFPLEYPETMANICFLETHEDPKTNEEFIATERNHEPIRDRSIVEMRYDPNKPVGWRWIPIRVRADKTARFLRGEMSLNSNDTAQSNWVSIQNPVTLHMIMTGSEIPSDKEFAEMNIPVKPSERKKYYERKLPEEDKRKVRPMHVFHNQYIKDTILYGSIEKHTSEPIILDLAVGRANDLSRWRAIGAAFVLGVDATAENALSKEDGSYSRLLQTMMQSRRYSNPMPIPPMFFVIADSSRRLLDGSACDSKEEADMLRAILGRVPPQGPVPPAIEKYGSGALEMGADTITCMYALHYFFKDSNTFNGFLQNIADNLKIGGYFVGTNFDGQTVFDFLRGTATGKSRIGMDGDKMIWEVTKEYELDELPIDDSGFGHVISNYFMSIGIHHKEYLVPWPLLIAKLKTIGLELLGLDDLKEIGMNGSTNMYDVSYKMAINTPEKKKYMMNPTLLQYSTLNRWYIFKRTSKGLAEIGNIAAVSTTSPAALAAAEEAADIISEAENVQPGTVAGEIAEGVVEEAVNAATAAALQATITESPVRSEFIASLAPAQGAAAAAALAERLAAAEAAKDSEQLTKLNSEAGDLRRAIQASTGIAPGGDRLAVGAPAGSVAKAFVSGYGIGAAGAGAAQTIPVMRPSGAPVRKLEKKDIVQFNENSQKLTTNLALPVKYVAYAGRHIAPNAPFRVRDSSDPSDITEYPSITHFLTAMKFKYATNRPDYALTVFSRDGKIHQDYLEQRKQQAAKKKDKKLTKDDQNKILEEETNEVLAQANQYLKARGTTFNDAAWLTRKNSFLEDAITQRIRGDKWFCVILNSVLTNKKYLLYYDTDPISEMGGAYDPKTKMITGQNKYGETIMRMGQTLPRDLQACLALPDLV